MHTNSKDKESSMRFKLSAAANSPHAALFSLLACTMILQGCGGSSSSSTGSQNNGSGATVIVGTNKNSLPSPPAQSNVNRYAGVDLIGGTSWNWRISHPDHSYNYQLQQGVSSSGSSANSGGIFTSLGDLDDLADTINFPDNFAGFNTEIDSGVAIFQQAFGGFPLGPGFAAGVLQQQTGCLAPNGTVNISFLHTPVLPGPANTYHPLSDTLYGFATLGYSKGVFHYSNVTQTASGGAAASTNTVPFTDSYCTQALAGYGMQSTAVKQSGTMQDMLAYLGSTGVMVGAIQTASASGAGETSMVGMVEPSAPVDLAKVTAGSYRGFYIPIAPSSQNSDPAYFGVKSHWVTAPVFTQSSTSLVGSSEGFYTLLSTLPTPTVTGNMVIDFGAQDANHNGLFPAVNITEPDPTQQCPAAQESTGSDGNLYCTFPAAALIGEAYGKYFIFLAGPEATTKAALFYALIQD